MRDAHRSTRTITRARRGHPQRGSTTIEYIGLGGAIGTLFVGVGKLVGGSDVVGLVAHTVLGPLAQSGPR